MALMLVRPARRGGDERNAIAEGAAREDLRQDVLEGPVSAVHDQQVDFLGGQLGEGLRHDAGVFRFDVEDVGMASQEAEHATDLLLALASAQVVDDTDSQMGPRT
jgi:hypothetical protein